MGTIRESKIFNTMPAKFPINIEFIDGKKKVSNLVAGWKKIKTDLSGDFPNFAILTGKIGGIVMIDLDKPKPDEIDGIQFFEDNICKISDLNTLVTSTISGGYHIYYKYTPKLKNSVRLETNNTQVSIDIRNDGGISYEGQRYNLVKDVEELEEVPEKFFKLLKGEAKRKKLDESIGNEVITDENIKCILDNLDETYYDNYHKWFSILCILKNGDYGIMTAKYFSSKSEKYDELAFEDFWNKLEKRDNGLGLGSLYYYLKDSVGKNRYDALIKKIKKGMDVIGNMVLTDFECYDMFVSNYRDTLFSTRDGKIFQRNEFGIWNETSTNYKEFRTLIRNFVKWLDIQGYNYNLNSASKRIEFMNSITIELQILQENKLNNNPYIFPFTNGVWDFESMTFRNGLTEEYITETCGYAYKKESSELSAAFIADIFPDSEIRQYFLTMIASYLIAMHTREEFFFLYNRRGNNGKSTFFRLLHTVFGNFYYQSKYNILVKSSSDGENANPALMGMIGKRFIGYCEMADNIELDSAQLKTLSGGDILNGRHLYGKSENFSLHAMQCAGVNEIPQVSKIDPAVIRRFRNIPMETEFVHEPTEKHQRVIKDIFVKDLQHSFFQLLVEHYNPNIKKGIQYCPVKIQEATHQYFNRTNGVLQFTDEFLVKGEGYVTKSILKDYLCDRDNIREYSFGSMKVEQLMDSIADVLNLKYEKIKKINGKTIRNVIMGCTMKTPMELIDDE